MINLEILKKEIKDTDAVHMAEILDNRCAYCAYDGKGCDGDCIKGIKEYLEQETPKTKRYYWILNIPRIHQYNCAYLNIVINRLVRLSSKNETNTFKTKFTESEYKELSEEYGFPMNMFVKEEIEE